MRALTRAAARSSTLARAAATARAFSGPAPIRRPASLACPLTARRQGPAGLANPMRTPAGRPLTMRTAAASADFPGRCVRVSHILLPQSTPDPAAALAALEAEIAGAADPGAAFADAARRVSACPSGSAAGGDLGWVARGATVPPFEDAAFATPAGGFSRAETDFGHHLLTVTEDKAGPVAVRQMGVLDLKEILEGGGGDGGGGAGSPRSAADAAEAAEVAAAGADVGAAGDAAPRQPIQLIDVREAHELEAAALPGFVLRPLSAFDPAGLDPAAKTIVLCHHGVRSQRVASHLVADLGFTDVWNVAGGIDAYARLADRGVPLY